MAVVMIAKNMGTIKQAIPSSTVTLILNIVLLIDKCSGENLMWLILLAFSSAITTAIWYSQAENDRYMLKLLSLILWGATIMVFVDHTLGYLIEGGEFLELTIDATVLGLGLLIVGLGVWEVILLLKDPKGVLHKRKA